MCTYVVQFIESYERLLLAVLGRTFLKEGEEMVEIFIPVYDSEILES